MGIFYNNNSNNKYDVELILESLKSKINSIVNNSFQKAYYQIETKNDLYNWKNEIINLILKEIDTFKYDLKKLIQDLNQKEPIKSEEQNRQNARLKSQKEKSKILNDNKSHQYYKENKQLAGNKSYQYYYENKQSAGDNFNKKSNQNKPLSGSKFYQLNNQNIQQNRQANDSKLIKKININQNKRLDIFTSKDIQEENKKITKIFQKEALNYINDDEKIENENIAKFLINVANVSRKAYNNSNELFINMFKEFSKITDGGTNISALKNDEQLRKEFSSWVKEYEKDPEGKKKYENYFNSFRGKGRYAEEDYISILLSQLTIFSL